MAWHPDTEELRQRYVRRKQFWRRWLRPPVPLVHNPNERRLEPSPEGHNLWLGGAGGHVPPRFVNVDIVLSHGVHAVADVHHLPFLENTFAAIECDAVLEHVANPTQAVREIHRVLQPDGELHVVVPFCHPFHAYPSDFQRWTTIGLRELLSAFEVEEVGVRTGPTATVLSFVLEYIKILVPPKLSTAAYGVAGWVLWPARVLDRWLLRKERAFILANSIYAFARKRRS